MRSGFVERVLTFVLLFKVLVSKLLITVSMKSRAASTINLIGTKISLNRAKALDSDHFRVT